MPSGGIGGDSSRSMQSTMIFGTGQTGNCPRRCGSKRKKSRPKAALSVGSISPRYQKRMIAPIMTAWKSWLDFCDVAVFRPLALKRASASK